MTNKKQELLEKYTKLVLKRWDQKIKDAQEEDSLVYAKFLVDIKTLVEPELNEFLSESLDIIERQTREDTIKEINERLKLILRSHQYCDEGCHCMDNIGDLTELLDQLEKGTK